MNNNSYKIQKVIILFMILIFLELIKNGLMLALQIRFVFGNDLMRIVYWTTQIVEFSLIFVISWLTINVILNLKRMNNDLWKNVLLFGLITILISFVLTFAFGDYLLFIKHVNVIFIVLTIVNLFIVIIWGTLLYFNTQKIKKI
ncbi:hypothetical protein [Mycoplasmopsis lipofaciens]|uniref:hypothetical protein n=1 Tax=Mycoplasmopsis lipofaciens TaxID=114884 RepID=UPI000487412B|nr:hypothetical protein [Mycoplasmopsis lipofaciens]